MFFKKQLAPGFLTVMNLFLGFYSIIEAGKGHYVMASWLIILAAVFDAFDGKVARATKSFSKFGVEFDSLADVVSFGLAPSFLVYQLHLHTMGPPGLIISFFPLVFGSIRLARFNMHLSGFEKGCFQGLPIPAGAATLASFIIFNFHIWGELWIPSLTVPIVILVSLLMVSTLEFDAMPTFNFKSGKKNTVQLLSLIIGLLLVIFFPQEMLFPLAVFYILYAAVRGLMKLGKSENGDSAGEKKTAKMRVSRRSQQM